MGEHRREVQDWLALHVNQFITVFRPRIEALMKEK
jgi:hypothetical protein